MGTFRDELLSCRECRSRQTPCACPLGYGLSKCPGYRLKVEVNSHLPVFVVRLVMDTPTCPFCPRNSLRRRYCRERRTEKSGGVLNVFKQNHSDGKIFDVSRVGLIGSQPL